MVGVLCDAVLAAQLSNRLLIAKTFRRNADLLCGVKLAMICPADFLHKRFGRSMRPRFPSHLHCLIAAMIQKSFVRTIVHASRVRWRPTLYSSSQSQQDCYDEAETPSHGNQIIRPTGSAAEQYPSTIWDRRCPSLLSRLNGLSRVTDQRVAKVVLIIAGAGMLSLMLVGNHSRRLDLDLGTILDEAGDLDQGHSREMPTYDRTIGGADFGKTVQVVTLVKDVPGQAHDVLRSCISFLQDGDNVFQRPLNLAHEVVRLELLLSIPADLACNKNLPAGCGNAVGISARPLPICRIQTLVHYFPSPNAGRLVPSTLGSEDLERLLEFACSGTN